MSRELTNLERATLILDEKLSMKSFEDIIVCQAPNRLMKLGFVVVDVWSGHCLFTTNFKDFTHAMTFGSGRIQEYLGRVKPIVSPFLELIYSLDLSGNLKCGIPLVLANGGSRPERFYRRLSEVVGGYLVNYSEMMSSTRVSAKEKVVIGKEMFGDTFELNGRWASYDPNAAAKFFGDLVGHQLGAFDLVI